MDKKELGSLEIIHSFKILVQNHQMRRNQLVFTVAILILL